MKIIEICEKFSIFTPTMAILSEVIDRGSRKEEDDDLDHDSDTYYREGEPEKVQYEDKDGNIKDGWVFVCPLCNKSGKNRLKTMGRLNATHLTQQLGDVFGGGCGVNRRDSRCVNGFLQDKTTGNIIWPDDSKSINIVKNDKESDNIKVGTLEFKNSEPELWDYMVSICKRGVDNPDPNKKQHVAVQMYHDFINNKETTQTKIDLLRRKYEDSKKPSRTMSNTLYRSQRNRKLGFDPNKDKKGYAVDDRSQQTFRPKKT